MLFPTPTVQTMPRITGEIPQSYHEFASTWIPPNGWHLMTREKERGSKNVKLSHGFWIWSNLIQHVLLSLSCRFFQPMLEKDVPNHFCWKCDFHVVWVMNHIWGDSPLLRHDLRLCKMVNLWKVSAFHEFHDVLPFEAATQRPEKRHLTTDSMAQLEHLNVGKHKKAWRV